MNLSRLSKSSVSQKKPKIGLADRHLRLREIKPVYCMKIICLIFIPFLLPITPKICLCVIHIFMKEV